MKRANTTVTQGNVTVPASVGYRKNSIGGYDAHIEVYGDVTLTGIAKCSAATPTDAIEHGLEALDRYGVQAWD